MTTKKTITISEQITDIIINASSFEQARDHIAQIQKTYKSKPRLKLKESNYLELREKLVPKTCIKFALKCNFCKTPIFVKDTYMHSMLDGHAYHTIKCRTNHCAEKFELTYN